MLHVPTDSHVLHVISVRRVYAFFVDFHVGFYDCDLGTDAASLGFTELPRP